MIILKGIAALLRKQVYLLYKLRKTFFKILSKTLRSLNTMLA